MPDYSYVGTGRTYMRERDVAGAWVEVGNVSRSFARRYRGIQVDS